MAEKRSSERAMIMCKHETRDRINTFVAQMCAVRGFKISQDTAINWLLDKYGAEIESGGLAELIAME